MLQIKDFVKCGSPYTPYELHVSREGMEELIKRDIAMDSILKLRDSEVTITPRELADSLIELTENLKN